MDGAADDLIRLDGAVSALLGPIIGGFQWRSSLQIRGPETNRNATIYSHCAIVPWRSYTENIAGRNKMLKNDAPGLRGANTLKPQ
jgi:hypothetical protein